MDLKVGTGRCASLKVGRQKVLLLCLFVLCKTSTDWTRPTHLRESNLLYSVCQFGCYSRLEAFSQTQQENVRPSIWMPCGLVRLTNNITTGGNPCSPVEIPVVPRPFLPSASADTEPGRIPLNSCWLHQSSAFSGTYPSIVVSFC